MKHQTILAAALIFLTLYAQAATVTASASAVAIVTPDTSPKSVLAVMKKVADWQLAQPTNHPPAEWTCAALYAGMMALSRISDDPKYHDAMMTVGEDVQSKHGR